MTEIRMTQSSRLERSTTRRSAPRGWMTACAALVAISGAGWWTGCSSSAPSASQRPRVMADATQKSKLDAANQPAPPGLDLVIAGHAPSPVASIKPGGLSEPDLAQFTSGIDVAKLGQEQDLRFLRNASNVALQSQTVATLDWFAMQPGAAFTIDKDGLEGASSRKTGLTNAPADPKAEAPAEAVPAAVRGGGGEPKQTKPAGDAPAAGADNAKSSGAAVPEKTAPTPGGPSVGRPSTGATPEARRDRVEVPLRVGADEEMLRKLGAELGDVRAEDAQAMVLRPLPKFDEELWVIARPTARAEVAPTRASPTPGVGTLWLGRGEGSRTAVMREFAADVTITGPVASVTVSQRFENVGSQTVDGVYVLPMPRDAAVTDFVMTIGTGPTQRKIRGVIRERAEAERIFVDAQKQGRVATMVGEDAANVLVQRIGNIAAGASVGTSVTYFGTLDYAGIPGRDGTDFAGAYEFVLPMRGLALASGDMAARVTVKIDAGLEILGGAGGVLSPTHAIEAVPVSATARTVTMGTPLTGGPGGDFVLRYAVAGATPRVGMVTQCDASGTYFSILVTPPAATGERPPLDLVIVPDLSGTNAGSLAAIKGAAAMLLGRLRPSDRFAVAIGTDEELIAATPEAIAGAMRMIESIQHESSQVDLSRRLPASVRSALGSGRSVPGRLVCVLSRGEISHGLDVLREARAHLGSSRIFAISVDEPAGFACESLARIGGGGVVHLSSADGARPANAALLARLLDREGSPVMTDLEIDWGGAEVADVFPRRLPDLCPGRPVHVVGRLLSPPQPGRAIKVTGTVRGESGVRRESLSAGWSAVTVTPGAIPTLWARAKVLMLGERLSAGDADAEAIRREIVALSLDHNLVSAMTAFVAVDAMSSVEPARGPLQIPAQGIAEGVGQATNVAPR